VGNVVLEVRTVVTMLCSRRVVDVVLSVFELGPDRSAAFRALVAVGVVCGHPAFDAGLAEDVTAGVEREWRTLFVEGFGADAALVVLRASSCWGVRGRHVGLRLVSRGCGGERFVVEDGEKNCRIWKVGILYRQGLIRSSLR
jgi:hypothetical protein